MESPHGVSDDGNALYTQKRLEKKDEIPLLSVRDVRLQTIAILLSQKVEIEEEIKQMLYRHIQREKDINRRTKNDEPDNLFESFDDNP